MVRESESPPRCLWRRLSVDDFSHDFPRPLFGFRQHHHANPATVFAENATDADPGETEFQIFGHFLVVAEPHFSRRVLWIEILDRVVWNRLAGLVEPTGFK